MTDLPQPRLITPADEEPVMAMCRRLHAENGLHSFDEDKVRKLIERHFKKEGSIIGVIGPPERLEASTCLAIAEFYYTTDWHLEEYWNFVDKDFRKSHNAEGLITFGMRCAEKMGIPLLTGIITNKQMAGKVRLYQRLLGHPAGAYFLHNAKWKLEPLKDHTDLRGRLKEVAKLCNDSPRKVTYDFAQKKLGPLLREAAEAISEEGNLWGAPTHANGSG